MKKFYILLIAMVALNVANAQWTALSSGTSNGLSSVYFPDDTTGYAVGRWKILKTSNAGESWTTVYDTLFAIYDGLNSVYFPDANTGYAVGGRGKIIKTADGGKNWTVQSFFGDTYYTFTSVFFSNTQTGYVVGYVGGGGYSAPFGRILQTTDGGLTWSIAVIPAYLNHVFFTTPQTGYVTGYLSMVNGEFYGIILKTNDGGATWVTEYTSVTANSKFGEIYFTDSTKGFVVSNHRVNYSDWVGTILKTIDGGKTWTDLLNYSIIGGLSSISFPTADTGYAVGEGKLDQPKHITIIKTTDAGLNWTAQSSGDTNSLYSVYFTDSNTGYSVGSGGTILKTTNGGGWGIGIGENSFASAPLKISPNPPSSIITIETPTKGSLAILNLDGQLILHKETTEPTTTIDVYRLKSGIYFVRLTGERMVQVGKFVKQ
jgi:photosystem II stability/assembly factor-like uncharacterized protein